MRGKVPTERTDYTEAYGINISEFTERIDAARHTTESTELIACVATPRLSMVAVYGGARLLYLYLLCLNTDQQAFISVDSCLAKRRPFCGFEKLKPVGFCGLCILWELHTKELQVKFYVHYTNIKMPTSTISPSLYHSKYRKNRKKTHRSYNGL